MRFGSEVVLDASAYVRATQGNVAAVDYLRAYAYGAVRFHAPPHFFVEVANALRNGALIRRESADEARSPLLALLRIDFELNTDPELAVDALDFALTHGITAYDAGYAALAIRRGAKLVTADSGLAQAAQAAGVATTLIAEKHEN